MGSSLPDGVYVTGAEFIKSQLALRAWRDAFSEGLDGMRAVCHVFRNRANAGWWGGDWIQILSHHKDASSRIEPDSDTLPDPRVYSFQCLLQEIDGIFSGAAKDDVTVPVLPTFTAGVYRPVLYYARLDQITNDWFLENISRKTAEHPRLAQVGQIFFFA